MGNSWSNGDDNEWRFMRDSGTVNDFTRLSSYYDGDTPQQVYIRGPLALSITLEIENANIEVTGVGHRICLMGKNNSINIRGSRIRIRIEGEDNKLMGDGEQVHLYTDDEVAVKDLELATSNKLRDEENNIVTDAPKQEVLEATLEITPNMLGHPAVLRCTYVPAPETNDADAAISMEDLQIMD